MKSYLPHWDGVGGRSTSGVICCQDMVVAPCSSCCCTWWGGCPCAWPLLLLSAVAEQPPHLYSLTVCHRACAWLQFCVYFLGSCTWFAVYVEKFMEATTTFILTASFTTDSRWQVVTRCQRLMVLVSSLTESLWPVHVHWWGSATWVRPGVNPGQCP